MTFGARSSATLFKSVFFFFFFFQKTKINLKHGQIQQGVLRILLAFQ